MKCPNCQNEVREGAVFCGSCGAAVPAAVPPAPEQAEYERQMAEYQRKQAEYEQQKAAYEQHGQQATVQMSPQQAAPTPQSTYAQPAPKKKTGLIIGIVAAVVVVLIGLAVAGILVARKAIDDAANEVSAELEVPITDDEDVPGDASPAGYATHGEAVTAALSEQGLGDWVARVYGEDAESAVYWAGPPNSEYVSELTVLKGPDGTWTVERIEGLDFGGDVPMAPADEAQLTVEEFLTAIQQDRADDAHALTIEPFSLDPASASYSNGEFTAFEIVSVEEQSDMTVWVEASETWYGTADSMWYYVVPTDAGYRISSAEVR